MKFKTGAGEMHNSTNRSSTLIELNAGQKNILISYEFGMFSQIIIGLCLPYPVYAGLNRGQ